VSDFGETQETGHTTLSGEFWTQRARAMANVFEKREKQEEHACLLDKFRKKKQDIRRIFAGL
jgi:hypothetical protein